MTQAVPKRQQTLACLLQLLTELFQRAKHLETRPLQTTVRHSPDLALAHRLYLRPRLPGGCLLHVAEQDHLRVFGQHSFNTHLWRR